MLGLSPKFLAVAAVIGLSIVGVLAEWLLKLASQEDNSWRSPFLVVGVVVFAATCLGWVYVLKHLKLASSGSIYCVSTVLLLAVLGTVVFGEKLSATELAGVGFAVISLILLGRHAA
ncbi:MAG: EamA family transporter [Opitutae bacterium]|nr:EamA family transporter [Opitutae bacterium]